MNIEPREYGQLEERVKNLDRDMQEMSASLVSIRNSIKYIVFFMVLMFADAVSTNPLLKPLLAILQ